jgi:hypothetical protein
VRDKSFVVRRMTVFETARMDKNGAPQMRLDRCFGVTTFELGSPPEPLTSARVATAPS